MFGTRLLSKLLQPFLRFTSDNLVPRTAFGVPKFGLSDDQTNYSKALLVQSRPPYRPLGLGRILLAAPLVLPVAAAGSDDSDEDDSDDEHQVEDDSQGKQLWCSGDSYGYTKGITVCITAQLFISSGLIHTALGTHYAKLLCLIASKNNFSFEPYFRSDTQRENQELPTGIQLPALSSSFCSGWQNQFNAL